MLTVITVDSIADNTVGDGSITLREAIEAANTDSAVGDAPAGSGADTIQFDSSLNGQTITLGGTELQITGELEIVGPGAAQLTIDGDGQSRVFSVANGITAGISGLKITGGFAGDGAGIHNLGDLTLSQVTVTGNEARYEAGQQSGGDGHGGGIFNAGSLAINDSSISTNTATLGGGGLANWAEGADHVSSVTISGSVISGNEATDGDGGGIYNDAAISISTSAEVTVADSTISENTASDKGGGFYNNSTLVVGRSTVSGNAAEGGGGLFNDIGGTLVATNSVIVGNTAVGSSGGGIESDGELVLTNSTVSGNWAAEDGGGLLVTWATTINNSIISHNEAGQAAGGISGDATINHSIVSQNSPGNELWQFDGENNLFGVDPGFRENPDAGTDGQWGTPDDDLGDLSLTATSAAVDAGDDTLAIDEHGDPLTADRDGSTRIRGAMVDVGAYEYQGLPSQNRETPSLVVTSSADGTDFYDGQITLREAIYYAQSGGGDTITFAAALDGATITLGGSELFLYESVDIDASTLDALTIDADERSRVVTVVDADTDDGNAVNVTLRGLTITGGVDRAPRGTGPAGGGIVNAGSVLTIVDVVVHGNESDEGGGGIGNSGNLTIAGSTISGNKSRFSDGGGVHSTGGTLAVVNSTIFENHTDFGLGGGIAAKEGATLTVTSSTIAGNSAQEGGGIYNRSSTTTLKNTIVASNSADSSPDLSGDLESGSEAYLIGGDARFVAEPAPGDDGVWGTADDVPGDYRLKSSSPAIDAGAGSALPADEYDLDGDGDTAETLPVDRDGNARVVDGDESGTATVDIGAFEFDGPIVEASGRVSVVIVRTPTDQFDDPTAGEVAALPQSAEWIDEWTSFYVEIWVDTPNTVDVGVETGTVDLVYDTDYFSTTAIEYGPAFTENPTGAIDEALGQIDNLGAGTSAAGVGDDGYALLARVRLEPGDGDAGIAIEDQGTYVTAVDHGVDISDGDVTLAGATASETELGARPSTELWPVMYDLDDNEVIDFGDFTTFATQFGNDVGEPGAEANDFDHSGLVDFGDFTLFAQNFAHARDDAEPVGYHGDFPEAWRPAALMLDAGDMSADGTASALTLQNLEPLAAEAVARLGAVDPSAAAQAALEAVTFEIVDLPGNRLGQAQGTLVQIDVDAAGFGWFVDATPGDDLEFVHREGADQLLAYDDGPANGRVDLLTTVMHELGHLIGYGHSDGDDAMHEALPPSVRRLFADDGAFGGSALDDQSDAPDESALTGAMFDEALGQMGF
jgi:CSLREA domain-containing protein